MSTENLRVLEIAERLGNLAESRLKALAASHGLQPVHLRILGYLAVANRYSNTPQAVADYLGLTKGTVSQSLILLEVRGLIARAADPRDRRVVRLSLTRDGAALGAELDAEARRWSGAVAGVGPGALETLTAVLRRLQRLEGRRSFGVCYSCRHHREEGPGRWRCGLTGEPLTDADRERHCREHEPEPEMPESA